MDSIPFQKQTKVEVWVVGGDEELVTIVSSGALYPGVYPMVLMPDALLEDQLSGFSLSTLSHPEADKGGSLY